MVKCSLECIDNTDYSIRIEGHAEYNPGNDIVCSAVSILAYTFTAAMADLGVDVKCTDNSGDYTCSCTITEDGKYLDTKARAVFDTITMGLRLLQVNYPANVSIEKLKIS